MVIIQKKLLLACGTGASECTNSTVATTCYTGYVLNGPTCNPVSSTVKSSANPVTTT